MSLKESIEEILQNIINDEFFIINVSVSGSASHPKITVLLDGDNGITIAKCAEVSRALGEEVEKRGLIEESFLLEISSPGVDLPLKFSRQYKRNIGRKLKIHLEDDSIKLGILKDVKEDAIILDEEIPLISSSGKISKNKKTTQEVEISFKNVKKSYVIISFN